MKKIMFLALIAMISMTACKTEPEAKGLGSDASGDVKKDNASYALGVAIGKDLKKDNIELDIARMSKGLTDGLGKGETEIPKNLVQQEVRKYFTDTTSAKDMNRISYAFGMSIASGFANNGLAGINIPVFSKGLNDYINAGDLFIPEEKADSTIRAYQEEQMKTLGDKTKAVGQAFLAENATKEGVKTTASGLQYKIIKEGTGRQPKETDQVTVHYVGKLIDGTTFDSSIDRGKPAVFGLNQVIKGWTEGLQLMKEGAKYKLYVPFELGYGGRPSGPIPAFSTLVFDVELLKVEDAPKMPNMQIPPQRK